MMAPARTGRESRRRTVVITTAQVNRGISSGRRFLARMFDTVAIKLIDPRIDEAPAR